MNDDLKTLVAQEVASCLATFTANTTVKKVLKFFDYIVQRGTVGYLNYVRFNSGVQFVYGHTGSSATVGLAKTVTLPVPFVDARYTVVATDSGIARGSFGVDTLTTSSFTLYTAEEAIYPYVLCIGYWK